MTRLVDEKAQVVSTDIQTESRNRLESIEHIKSCLKTDFPKLEELIKREYEDREEGDGQLENHLTGEI